MGRMDREGLKEADPSSAQESLAQVPASLPLTFSFPVLVRGQGLEGGERGSLRRERVHLTKARTRLLPAMPQGGCRAVSSFRKNVEKRWLLENMDGAFLVVDEIVDGG